MRRLVTLVALVALAASACGDDDDSAGSSATGATDGSGEGVSLTIYSGREEELVGPLFARYEEETGVDLEVRYGDSAELASQILEEGSNSPADVFFAQDAGSLGAVEASGAFAELPADLLDLVPTQFRSADGRWVGTSGRARVLVYNTEAVDESELPTSTAELTEERWKGKVGWAPTNGSFQSFVTAFRRVEGEDAAREWLEKMKANDAQVYEGNSAIVQAVLAGEIDAGLVNHYYLLRTLAETPGAPGANHFFAGGDPGSLVNTAGVGVVKASSKADAALDFVRFLLSEEAQTYFAGEAEDDGFEFPLIDGVASPEGVPALAAIEHPDVDLSDLSDLEATLALLAEVGLV